MKKAICYILLLGCVAATCITSCRRIYVYKRQAGTTDSVPVIAPPAADFPTCNVCTGFTAAQNQWSFKIGNSSLCGGFDKSVINIERNTFTFFGPSACAIDTGLVLTASIGTQALVKDYYNLTVPKVDFIYYKTGAADILYNQTVRDVSMVIESYIHSTRIASGRFSGKAYKRDSSVVLIENGRFVIKL